jgi:hypothetical protein
MAQYHIYQSHSVSFSEAEFQPRSYSGFVEADSLEKAFEYAQNDHVDWAMNEVRSTSVGDVIQSDDGLYMVCNIGFKLLDGFSKDESELGGLEYQTVEC